MTRLTEALERARLVSPAPSPVTTPAVKSADEVLQTWYFDADGRRARRRRPPGGRRHRTRSRPAGFRTT